MDIKRLICLLLALNHFPTIVWTWNHTFVFGFLESFIYRVPINEVVWFLSGKLGPAQSEHADEFIKRLSERKYLTQYVWTNRTDVHMINIGSLRISIGLVITTGARDPVMYMHNRLLMGRHFGLSLVIYTLKVADMSPIEELVDLLYRGNFVNSLVYFQTIDGKDHLFGFTPYPRYSLRDMTEYWVTFLVELQKVAATSRDVLGFRFYTPLKQDVPNVFTYDDTKGKKKVQGTAYCILDTFMQSLNANLVEYQGLGNEVEIINMKAVLDLVRSKKIQIAAHAYALFQADDDVDKSYPIMVVKWCLMVPLRNSISTFLFALQPFEWTVWFLVVSVLLALCILDYFLWCTGVTQLQLGDLWLNNYCHILNIGPAFQVVRPTGRRFLYYLTVFWFGFFLSAYYTSYLGSFLTVSLFREQINTIEDLVNAQLPVMIIDYELKFLLSEGFEPPPDFNDLLLAVDSATFYGHQMTMNASFAYFITDDRWHFLHATQKHLTQKIFKFSDICFGSYHLAYPMEKDSPIWRDLEYFMFRIHSSGLFQMYEKQALHYALATGHIKRVMEADEYAAVGLDHLEVMFGLLAVMYLISAVCVILEMSSYGRGDS